MAGLPTFATRSFGCGRTALSGCIRAVFLRFALLALAFALAFAVGRRTPAVLPRVARLPTVAACALATLAVKLAKPMGTVVRFVFVPGLEVRSRSRSCRSRNWPAGSGSCNKCGSERCRTSSLSFSPLRSWYVRTLSSHRWIAAESHPIFEAPGARFPDSIACFWPTVCGS